jgi:glucose/arabinose dehydrogenase
MKHIIIFLLVLAAIPHPVLSQLVEKKVIVAPQFQSIIDTNKTVMIPDEYEINVFYTGILKRPRFMALGPNNTIYVADMDDHHIVALPDANHNGIADSAHIAAPDVDTAHSIAFYNGALYVAQPSRVRKFLDLNNDGFYETEQPFISGISDTGYYNHFTRTIIFDTMGNHIYLGVGASCNACREGDPERGTILQFNLDGSGKKIFATGLRNPIGLTIDPLTGSLWATNADRDGLGDNIPPEVITTVAEGEFFGWPFAYEPNQWINFQTNQEYQAILPITKNDSIEVGSMRFSEMYIPAHSTPMEILPYGAGFLIALHGSSPGGRPVAVGYKVILLQYEGNLKGWQTSDFLKGFLTDSVNYKFWGRPCGMVQDSSGDIYLSSDQGIPAIYRIHLKDQNAVKNSDIVENSLSVFPNPASSSATISYSLSKRQSIKLEIIDQLGRTIRLLRNESEDAGMKTISISTNDLPEGMYYLRLKNDAALVIEKVIVTK